jgi:hypothetical protein
MNRGIFIASLLCLAATSSAQIIFEPVQFQYPGPRGGFYYGGDDPRQLAAAERNAALLDAEQRFGVVTRPVPVYSDLRPFEDARRYGFTPTDAYNDAQQSLPRYFRKSELLHDAIETSSGHVIPARAGDERRWSIDIHPGGPATSRRTAPSRTTNPSRDRPPVIVFPREWMDRPAFPESKPRELRADAR